MPATVEYDAPREGRDHPARTPAGEAADEVIRWGAFSCALVPVVLLVCGSPFGAAAGAAAGLAVVTVVCRALLRRCERTAARLAGTVISPHRGRHGRTGIGAHRGGRRG
ncbi:hypothetical protein SBI_06912 [Streptomyces bingchenggensis BCW-1]|uniref:Uncharacterized protein n=1 Tax=Streptomyces bingchenggensis (strain BCW-1) TaxID=749414 RepID=D7C1G7_STRBB|nr:hypothetical protein [Streptomyces milbemycinicus]ADI10032.1 hypothetical protein SBI_06912 [Streptomyces bingchenggensis BCW-1]